MRHHATFGGGGRGLPTARSLGNVRQFSAAYDWCLDGRWACQAVYCHQILCRPIHCPHVGASTFRSRCSRHRCAVWTRCDGQRANSFVPGCLCSAGSLRVRRPLRTRRLMVARSTEVDTGEARRSCVAPANEATPLSAIRQSGRAVARGGSRGSPVPFAAVKFIRTC